MTICVLAINRVAKHIHCAEVGIFGYFYGDTQSDRERISDEICTLLEAFGLAGVSPDLKLNMIGIGAAFTPKVQKVIPVDIHDRDGCEPLWKSRRANFLLKPLQISHMESWRRCFNYMR